jgi:hypothetical protein
MKTLTELLPLAIGVAVVGVVTWYLLTRDWAAGPWLLAGLLFAHGWVHLMFVFPQPDPAAATAGGPAWPFDMGHSWLITGPGLDVGLVRIVGITFMAVVFVGFVLAALSTVGLLVPAGWWPALLIGSAAGSLLLLTMFFSPTFLLGYGIDLALLWLILASGWSPTAASIP